MSVNEKMTAIADAIRDKTGGTDALTLDDMAQAIPDVYDAGRATSKLRYYSELVPITARRNYIDLPIDFFPDQVVLFTTKTSARDTAATMVMLNICFLPTTDGYCGNNAYNLNGGSATSARLSAYYGTSSGGAHRLLTETADGYRISAGTISGTTMNYDTGEYKVIAVKFSDKSDKEMLTEYVHALPNTAQTVYIASLMCAKAFTDAEWDALIAEKPNTTFVLH